MERETNTIYTLSLSYGKDSLACLGAIEKLGLPLDRIVHAEVWATETIPADLPPMVEFKKKADKIIKERYGIEVEHVWATKKVANGGGVLSYDSVFRTTTNTKEYGEHIYGFPKRSGAWCVGLLKQNLLTEANLRRYFLSRDKEETRGGHGTLTDSRYGNVNGATTCSKSMPSTIYGFPYASFMGGWCRELKNTAIKNLRVSGQHQYGKESMVYGAQKRCHQKSVFFKPENDGRYKYRSVSWNSKRRTRTHSKARKEERNNATACYGKLGRGVLPKVVRRKGFTFPDLHNGNKGRLLVLPQSRRRTIKALTKELS